MKRFYKLDLRIHITERDDIFTVEPLEIVGRVRASDRDQALECLAMCIEGALAAGEPLWRQAPEDLLQVWNSGQSSLSDGSTIQRMTLKVRGQKDLLQPRAPRIETLT